MKLILKIESSHQANNNERIINVRNYYEPHRSLRQRTPRCPGEICGVSSHVRCREGMRFAFEIAGCSDSWTKTASRRSRGVYSRP